MRYAIFRRRFFFSLFRCRARRAVARGRRAATPAEFIVLDFFACRLLLICAIACDAASRSAIRRAQRGELFRSPRDGAGVYDVQR